MITPASRTRRGDGRCPPVSKGDGRVCLLQRHGGDGRFNGAVLPGDHFIVSDDLYGGSVRYFRTISEKNGLTFDAADTGDLGAVRRLMKRETKAVFVETPTNPMMQVTDLAALSEMLRQEGVLLIVDNTFLTPYFQRPLQLGADIVLPSGTKYLGGHNDTLAGFLVTNRPEIAGRLRQLYKTVGACLAPFDSWLIIRGLKTLAVRLERQAETAEKIARWLLEHPRVTQVLYPGLPEPPGYDVMKSRRRVSGRWYPLRWRAQNSPWAFWSGCGSFSAESLGVWSP